MVGLVSTRRRAARCADPAQAGRGGLACERQRLRLLVETVEDIAIFMLDPNGQVASWHACAEQITGYPAADDPRLSRLPPLRARGGDGRATRARSGDRARRRGDSRSPAGAFAATACSSGPAVVITPIRDDAGAASRVQPRDPRRDRATSRPRTSFSGSARSSSAPTTQSSGSPRRRASSRPGTRAPSGCSATRRARSSAARCRCSCPGQRRGPAAVCSSGP